MLPNLAAHQAPTKKEGKEELIQGLAARHFQALGGNSSRQQSVRRRSINNAMGHSVRTLLLMKFVEGSFMPKLTAKGKEYCKSGHQLELPFGKKLLKHSKEGITRFRVEKLYLVGLVGKSGEMYAKASANFIGIAIIDNVETLVAIECKARLTPAMHQREREHAELLSRGQGHYTSTSSSTLELYTIIEASSGDFHKYVNLSHEAVQLMHTAYVYGLELCNAACW